ncbi:ATP-binding cassette domain-containing protein [Sporolactobacillus kofuensis]|uniref:ATP-binding cassette domain-containing protein n=1 Tax=Sporolactobacillus kofuensis TaxID=269672 RepID=A0ABW1WDU9_9BACL|nr:ATP-binding cassette domain-containing protein [Sporolactobacillus kofuensis]MCO7175013.1 ATP-binding cassette domain-containing protein [Sporolactobacillus kofuensis]
MTTVIADHVSKKIKRADVLNDISYTFYDKHIYGLSGRNGSGKTMLIRALCGLIYINHGTIKINEKVLHRDISFPSSIGVIIEKTDLLPEYSAFTNLKILSKVKRVASDQDIKSAIERVGLDPTSKMPVRKFSLGMKQRLSIAQAIFEKPEILLLDEPTNAIDKNGVELVRDILVEEKERGALIVIASHNQDDLDILADTVLTVEEGHLVGNDEK